MDNARLSLVGIIYTFGVYINTAYITAYITNVTKLAGRSWNKRVDELRLVRERGNENFAEAMSENPSKTILIQPKFSCTIFFAAYTQFCVSFVRPQFLFSLLRAVRGQYSLHVHEQNIGAAIRTLILLWFALSDAISRIHTMLFTDTQACTHKWSRGAPLSARRLTSTQSSALRTHRHTRARCLTLMVY